MAVELGEAEDRSLTAILWPRGRNAGCEGCEEKAVCNAQTGGAPLR